MLKLTLLAYVVSHNLFFGVQTTENCVASRVPPPKQLGEPIILSENGFGQAFDWELAAKFSHSSLSDTFLD